MAVPSKIIGMDATKEFNQLKREKKTSNDIIAGGGAVISSSNVYTLSLYLYKHLPFLLFFLFFLRCNNKMYKKEVVSIGPFPLIYSPFWSIRVC